MNPIQARRLLPVVLASLLTLPGLASAQGSTAAPAAAPQGEKTVRSMYAFADQNKNGQLTRAEAKGHLPFTYSEFASIDSDKRGWISFEQFLAYTNKRVGKQADDIMKGGEWL